MKKTITSILEPCQPQELDAALQTIDADLPDEASADRIKRLAMQKAGIPAHRHTGRRIALIAACITLIAGVLVGCYVAEKVEYDNAVKFFDLNDLDTEGMSRDDIKRVWRDITTERFAYNDSYELLSESCCTVTVEGVDISISNSANNANNLKNGDIAVLNSGYPDSIRHGDIPDTTLYFVGDEFEKDIADKVIWRTKLPHCYENYFIAGGRALIWGSYIYDETHDYMHTSVVLIDDKDGTILWEKTLDSQYHFDEYPRAVLTDDGRIAVLTVATDDRFTGENYLVFRELDLNGEIVVEHEQRKDDICYTDLLTPLSDGWLAVYDRVFFGGGSWTESYLLKLDKNGVIQNQWSFSENDSDGFQYEIADIIEHDGKLYISAQARPNASTLYENADYENFPENTDSLADGFSDEWRDRAREEFSSVLYVFDPESDKPEEFYSVGGTLPGSLRTDDDGNLVWRVGRIVKCGWAPWANSFQLYGVTRQYDYTFDSDKTVLKQEKTGVFNSFRTM